MIRLRGSVEERADLASKFRQPVESQVFPDPVSRVHLTTNARPAGVRGGDLLSQPQFQPVQPKVLQLRGRVLQGVRGMRRVKSHPHQARDGCRDTAAAAVVHDPSPGAAFAAFLPSCSGHVPFLQKSSSAHRNTSRISRSFTSNFAKIWSHFALLRHSRHEPHVQR